jgi:hypothetical protein
MHNMNKATNSIEEEWAALDNEVARAIFDNQMQSVLHAGVGSAQEEEMRETDDYFLGVEIFECIKGMAL